jgi:hypothetical protein
MQFSSREIYSRSYTYFYLQFKTKNLSNSLSDSIANTTECTQTEPSDLNLFCFLGL